MANTEHLAILKQGVEVWNAWRGSDAGVPADLYRANLAGARLSWANLKGATLKDANLTGADLSESNLSDACLWASDLRDADLSRARLYETDLHGADLSAANLTAAELVGASLREAELRDAHLIRANLRGADLAGADLRRANLSDADLRKVDLIGARLTGTNLSGTDFRETDLSGVDLSNTRLIGTDLSGMDLIMTRLDGADLSRANLYRTNLRGASLRAATIRDAKLAKADLSEVDLSGADLRGADLTDCRVYRIAVWDITVDARTLQTGLVVTPPDRAAISVDEIEIAPFLDLVLNKEAVRGILGTLSTRLVLILGRFTEDRKKVLDAFRKALQTGYGGSCVVFSPFINWRGEAQCDTAETVKTLACLSAFVLVDLADPRAVPHEFYSIVPDLASVPVQPLVPKGRNPGQSCNDLRRFPWVLPPYEYDGAEDLLHDLPAKVLAPAAARARALMASG